MTVGGVKIGRLRRSWGAPAAQPRDRADHPHGSVERLIEAKERPEAIAGGVSDGQFDEIEARPGGSLWRSRLLFRLSLVQ
jgi:hypothetical protein